MWQKSCPQPALALGRSFASECVCHPESTSAPASERDVLLLAGTSGQVVLGGSSSVK